MTLDSDKVFKPEDVAVPPFLSDIPEGGGLILEALKHHFHGKAFATQPATEIQMNLRLDHANSMVTFVAHCKELYNLETDPSEVENLTGKPEHPVLLATMRDALEMWQKETCDRRLWRDGAPVVGYLPSNYAREGLRIPDRFDFDITRDSGLLQLSQSILAATGTIVRHLQDTNQEEPSFDQNSPVIQTNTEIDEIRILLNEAAHDLLRLVNGPVNEYRSFFMTPYTLAAYQVALHFGIFRHVPLGGKINVFELAPKVGIDQDLCGRVVKHLATQHVFAEVEPDVFSHTASSALVARNSDVEALLLMQFDEMFKAASEASTFVQNTAFKSSSDDSPFITRHGKPPYLFYAENPGKGVGFAKAMAALTKMDRSISTLRDGFPWGEIKAPGKVVDVGGASGHISIQLASHFQNLNFVVQDLSSEAIANGKARLTPDIAKRVTFMQYDFFNEQPITDANAFFLRQCLHNWRDEDCIKIIRALVPALEKCKRDTPLLINEEVLPELNEVPKYQEHLSRQCDMCMFVITGAKERSGAEFEKLLRAADPRFEVILNSLRKLQTMAEIIGLVASIGTIAAAGFKAATTISTIAHELGGATVEIMGIGTDMKAVALILRQLKKRLEGMQRVTREVRDVAHEIVALCQADVKDIEEFLKPLTYPSGKDLGLKQKIKWLFDKAKVSSRRASLDSLKLTLNLFLHILDFSEDGEVEEYIREEMSILVAETQHTKTTLLNAEWSEATRRPDEAYLPSPMLRIENVQPESASIGAGTVALFSPDVGYTSTEPEEEECQQMQLANTLPRHRSREFLESMSDDDFIQIAEHVRLQNMVRELAIRIISPQSSNGRDSNLSSDGYPQRSHKWQDGYGTRQSNQTLKPSSNSPFDIGLEAELENTKAKLTESQKQNEILSEQIAEYLAEEAIRAEAKKQEEREAEIRKEVEDRFNRKMEEIFQAQEEAKKQQGREIQIRKEAEKAFQRRMEDMRLAQEEAKEEIERAKVDAENSALERLRKKEEAEREQAREREELVREAQEHARLRFEAESKAAEDRRKAENEAKIAAEEEARKKFEAQSKAAEEQRKAENEARKQAEKEAREKIEAESRAAEEQIQTEKMAREAISKESEKKGITTHSIKTQNIPNRQKKERQEGLRSYFSRLRNKE
ncbi:hypothetical protein F53441_8162 [Fusarium austroafricanum]|uniref:O-methyltransferase C-terminal domain-containing protein n=1 Tax=Fusarium austroafricanum TaxID=2364996 RepID=A0A8H4NRF9_9HYPO|nr:hypothetical protein F53441_8162 [Fusarium austroafricanum]